jgi:uncharacterized Rossmann fold enzyme
VKDPLYAETIFIIHAHGDNIEKIDEFSSFILDARVIGTTQTNTHLPVVNSGGFTDGDRALYFFENFLSQNHKLFLVGFDFGTQIGKYSKPHYDQDILASKIKRKKLEYGALITRNICQKYLSQIQFLEITKHFLHKDTFPSSMFINLKATSDLSNLLKDLLFLKQ